MSVQRGKPGSDAQAAHVAAIHAANASRTPVAHVPAVHASNARPAKVPTLRAFEQEVATGVGMAPYGPNPPATSAEIQQMANDYAKAYGKKRK